MYIVKSLKCVLFLNVKDNDICLC